MKNIKKLLIPLIVLVLLIVGLVLAKVLTKNEPTDDSVTKYNLVKLLSVEVSKVEVTRPNMDNLVLQNIGAEDSQDKWTYIGGSQSEYSQSSINYFLVIALDFSADEKLNIDNPNYADYGLDNPDYSIEITKKSGEVVRILLGDDLYDSNRCYVMLEGDPSVYTITSVKKSICNYNEMNFLNSVTLGIDFTNVKEVEFVRRSDNLKMTATCDTSIGTETFEFYEPLSIESSSYFNAFVKSVASLEIASFDDFTDEQIQEKGLDSAEYNLTFVNKDGSNTTISFTEFVDGVAYGYGSFCDNYFRISSQQIQYQDLPIERYIDSFCYYLKVTDIRKITVNYDDKQFVMDIDTSDTISSDDAKVFVDSRDAKVFSSSGRCYGAILFESIACISIGGVDLDATPTNEDSVITIQVLKCNNSYAELSFVKRDAASFYCFIDGEYSGFYVYESELYRDGGTNTYDYGIVAAYDLLCEAIDNNIGSVYDRPIEVA